MVKETATENAETENTTVKAKTASVSVSSSAKTAETINTETAAQKSDSVYTVDDLAAAEQKIGARKTIIRVALKKAGKDRYTLDEAKEIVAKFKTKEVKG